jgi:hypothetical protein
MLIQKKYAAILCFIFLSCTEKVTQKKDPNTKQTESTKSIRAENAGGANSDTLLVAKRAAVFTEPDSLQIEKMKKEMGSDNFYTGADDFMYYSSLAREFLDSMKLPVIDCKNKNYIKFIDQNGLSEITDLHKDTNGWNLYFFDPARKPQKANLTGIRKSYLEYFK